MEKTILVVIMADALCAGCLQECCRKTVIEPIKQAMNEADRTRLEKELSLWEENKLSFLRSEVKTNPKVLNELQFYVQEITNSRMKRRVPGASMEVLNAAQTSFKNGFNPLDLNAQKTIANQYSTGSMLTLLDDEADTPKVQEMSREEITEIKELKAQAEVTLLMKLKYQFLEFFKGIKYLTCYILLILILSFIVAIIAAFQRKEIECNSAAGTFESNSTDGYYNCANGDRAVCLQNYFCPDNETIYHCNSPQSNPFILPYDNVRCDNINNTGTSENEVKCYDPLKSGQKFCIYHEEHLHKSYAVRKKCTGGENPLDGCKTYCGGGKWSSTASKRCKNCGTGTFLSMTKECAICPKIPSLYDFPWVFFLLYLLCAALYIMYMPQNASETDQSLGKIQLIKDKKDKVKKRKKDATNSLVASLVIISTDFMQMNSTFLPQINWKIPFPWLDVIWKWFLNIIIPLFSLDISSLGLASPACSFGDTDTAVASFMTISFAVFGTSFVYMVWLMLAKIYMLTCQKNVSKIKVQQKWFFVKYILFNSLVHLLLVFLFTTVAKNTFTALAWGKDLGTDKQRGTSMHFILSIFLLLFYLIIPYVIMFIMLAKAASGNGGIEKKYKMIPRLIYYMVGPHTSIKVVLGSLDCLWHCKNWLWPLLRKAAIWLHQL